MVDSLYRGLGDNSVGRVIDTQLRNDLILVDDGPRLERCAAG